MREPLISPQIARLQPRSLEEVQAEALQRLAAARQAAGAAAARRRAAEEEVQAAWRACINLGCADQITEEKREHA